MSTSWRYRCTGCGQLTAGGSGPCSVCSTTDRARIVAPDERAFDVDEEATTAERRQRVQPVLARSIDEIRELVPTASGGLVYVACPNCDHGKTDRAPWEWDPSDPDRIECGSCGAVYPDNPDYPDDEFVEVDAPEGTHRFRYYERPADGHRLFFESCADYFRRDWLERRVRDLGHLYYETGIERYAAYAGAILHRFAEVVPGWAYRYDFPFEETRFAPYDEGDIDGAPAHRTTLWTRWIFDDVPTAALAGYESIMGWEGLDAVAEGDVAGRIESDFFAHLTEYVLDCEPLFGNACPRIFRDATLAGRVLTEPEWVHEAVRRFERMLDERFYYDGQWCEPAPAYHRMTMLGLRSFVAAVEGYTDPPGYRHPETGERFDAFGVDAAGGQWELAEDVLETVRFPDGCLLPVNDSWATPDRKRRYRDEATGADEPSPFLLGGLGVGALGGGGGDDRWLAWLNATTGADHAHRDALSIGLWARGRELLPDIGYTHTRYRRSWAASTMAHNTVVVDGRESGFDESHRATRIAAFEATLEGFQVVRAESEAAYPDRTDRYRRTLVAVGSPAADGYLVDLFDVAGGDQHDYVLHGSADEDATAAIDGVALSPFDGDLMNDGIAFEPPDGQYDRIADGQGAYGMIRDLERGDADDTQATIDMRLESESEIGTRTVLAPLPDLEWYRGRSPSIRRAEEDDLAVDEFWMPTVVARRRGSDLETRFVAAHEPVAGEPTVEAVGAEHAGAATKIAVEHADGRDHLLLSRAGTASGTFETEDGRLGFEGRCALFRVDSTGDLSAVYAFGCTRVSVDDCEVTVTPGWSGAVVGAERIDRDGAKGMLVVDGAIDATEGTVILRFPDGSAQPYNVVDVEVDGDRSRIVTRELPGFDRRDGETVLTAYPGQSIAGTEITYEFAVTEAIDPAAFLDG